MIIKQHLSGVAIAYEPRRKRQSDEKLNLPPSRPQGSLYSQQKRAIADGIEYMRRYGKHRPLIFCLTSPGFTDLANEQKLVSRFVNNLRMRHDLEHYVWVRELTGNGYPHFHFVATVPRFDAVKMSLLWSSYFNSEAKNSIRMGTRPGPNGRRTYYVNSARMAYYLSKYIGKNVSGKKGLIRRVRAFAISEELRELSAPAIYHDEYITLFNNKHERQWTCEQLPDWIETEGYLRTERYRWKQPNELHNVFIGTLKKIAKKQ